MATSASNPVSPALTTASSKIETIVGVTFRVYAAHLDWDSRFRTRHIFKMDASRVRTVSRILQDVLANIYKPGDLLGHAVIPTDFMKSIATLVSDLAQDEVNHAIDILYAITNDRDLQWIKTFAGLLASRARYDVLELLAARLARREAYNRKRWWRRFVFGKRWVKYMETGRLMEVTFRRTSRT